MTKISNTRAVDKELFLRLEKIFALKQRVYFSFSGGKDSLCIAKALELLILQGKIDPNLLYVLFIDEEGVYPCVITLVHQWRERYLSIGAHFYWLCLEWKHFNCFNSLANDESFICWDREKSDVWIRQPPVFAIRSHPLFSKGMTYQEFLMQIHDFQLVGVRAFESCQRQANMLAHGGVNRQYFYPLFDFHLNDVWLFLQTYQVEIPAAYFYLWKLGYRQEQLRLTQFFSIDTAGALVRLMEFYPDLYEKILRREPNARLAMMYWDSEMFRRNTKHRKQLEGTDSNNDVDYKALFFQKLRENTHTGAFPKETTQAKKIALKYGEILSPLRFRDLTNMMTAGDPKHRTYRSVCRQMMRDMNVSQ